MSKHLNGESSNQNTTPLSNSAGFQLVSSLSWRNLRLVGRKRTLLAWGCIACVPGLIIGLVAFFSSVAPLEKRLLELEAHGLARDIDSVVKVREAAVRIAVGGIGHEGLSEAGELDSLLRSFRSTFRDFLSLEVLDKRGEVMAMAGELPLSQARRFSGTHKPMEAGTALSPGGMFEDGPKTKDFFITVKHESKDGTVWYSRTRYSRDSIERILSSGRNQWQASLTKASGGEDATTGRSVGNWWEGLDTAEVSLETPGWTVKLEKPSKRVLLSKGPIIFVALVLLISVLACLYRRFTPFQRGGVPGHLAVAHPNSDSPDLSSGPIIERQDSFIVEASGKDDSSEVDREDGQDHDVWTPRNVPMGIVESLEPDSPGIDERLAGLAPTVDLCNEEDPREIEMAQESASEGQNPNESDSGASPTASHAGDIPETIDLTWFEPAGPITDSGDACKTGPSPTVPEAKTRMVAIPESLEVSWSEPKSDKSDDPHDEQRRNRPTTYYTA